MTEKLPAIAQLNRALASPYNAASAADLRWKNEKVFFEAQVRKNWQIAKAVREGNETTIESLKLAARECASMGLSMSTVSQLVYFIPRRARKRRQGESDREYESVPWVVTATPSYRGLSYIATHYAGARLVAAEVVYAADQFRYFGPIREPIHEPTLDNKQRTEDKAIGVYAVVVMDGGLVRAEYTDAPTIVRIRQLSEFPNGLMWTKLWTEGWRKVPLRRIAKTTMNSAPRMLAAVESLNRYEGAGEAIAAANGGGNDPDKNPGSNHGKTDEPAERPRGMSGLRDTLNGEYTRVPDEPEPEPEPPPRFHVESVHPPGSIEYWYDQINHARNFEDLEDVKVLALERRVDCSDDVELFRTKFAERRAELRSAAP